MRKQRGFTLVELIVVIVILGILAAMALPRFAGMQGDARLSKMQGLLGSFRSASSMAHSAQLVTINSTHSTTVTIEGNSVGMVNGYPTAQGILIAAGLLKATDTPSTGMNAGDYYLSFYDATKKVSVVAPDEARKNQCVVVYVESTGLNTGTVAAPVYANAQSGTPPQIGIFDHVIALGLVAGTPTVNGTAGTNVAGTGFATTNFDTNNGKADAAHLTTASGSAEAINGRDCE